MVLCDQLIYPGLQYPNPDKVELKKEKLGHKIAENHLALQLNRFHCFGREIDAIEKAEYGEQVQRKDNREKHEDGWVGGRVMYDHAVDKMPDDRKNERKDQRQINDRDEKEYLKLRQF